MAQKIEVGIVPPEKGSRQPVVLQILPALQTGGVERGTIEIAEALVSAGWKAVVISNGGQMVHELERAGALHITMPVHSKNPLVMWRNIQRIMAVIKEHNVSLVHARSRAPAWSAWRAARRMGVPFITTYHGAYNDGGSRLKRRYNSIMARGDKVIAISNFIADHIRQKHAIDESKLRIIQRGADLEKFDPLRVSAERIIQLARQWRLPDGCRVIMLPGRLTRWKGQKVLIEALALLNRTDVRCLMVGSDQGRSAYRQELLDQVIQLGLDGVVHVVDECRDMPAAYMLTDVVISASTDPEAFGRTVVEAQAMGRPVIVSDHGGARETILPGRTGWAVPPADAQALAEAIDRALSLNEEERYRLAQWSLDHVRRNFSRHVMCDKTLAVYAEVLGIEPPVMEVLL